MILRSGVVAGLTLVGACTQYTTYGYQYRMQQSFGSEEPESAPREARELLASARTVAFYPPDVCVNADVSKSGQLHANCGVMMSSLERAAEDAGYEVVSWQNLRGNKRAIDFARESNVDVLFEVNEFDLGELVSSEIQQTLSFFQQDERGGETPVIVSSAVAQTCAAYAKAANPPRSVGEHGTIDIKTVSVADGRMRWRYRKVLSSSNGTPDTPGLFRGQNQPRKSEVALGVIGGLALIGGATLITFEQLSKDDPLTPQDDHFSSGGASIALTIAGIAAIVGAVVVHSQLGTEKPDPGVVLCDPRLAVAPPVMISAAPVTFSAEHTIQTTQTTQDAASEQRLRQLSGTMIAQFVGELKTVHPMRPTTPPPPPTPVPAQPAPGATP